MADNTVQLESPPGFSHSAHSVSAQGDFALDTAELNFEENLTTALNMAASFGESDERTTLCRMAVSESFWAALRLVQKRPDLLDRYLGRDR